jgi:glycine cleavage system H protein
MTKVRGCEVHEDLYYLLENHVWAKPLSDGVLRVGITSAGAQLAGPRLLAVTVRPKTLGQEVAAGRNVAMLESTRFTRALPAPVTGILLRSNISLLGDPDLVLADPYGEGWIVEMQPRNWEADKAGLLTGERVLAAYEAIIESEDIRCAG